MVKGCSCGLANQRSWRIFQIPLHRYTSATRWKFLCSGAERLAVTSKIVVAERSCSGRSARLRFAPLQNRYSATRILNPVYGYRHLQLQHTKASSKHTSRFGSFFSVPVSTQFQVERLLNISTWTFWFPPCCRKIKHRQKRNELW